MVLLLSIVHLAVIDGGSLASAQTPGGGSPPAGGQPPAGTAPGAGTRPPLEDHQGWSPDKKAEEATKHMIDIKAQANRRKDDPCPKLEDWDEWLEQMVTVETCWVAMKEIRNKVKKSGAGGTQVKNFVDAFGSSGDWETLVNALRQKMAECAEKLGKPHGLEEAQRVAERERQKTAIELGEFGFGPRVQLGCPGGDCPPGRGTPQPAGTTPGGTGTTPGGTGSTPGGTGSTPSGASGNPGTTPPAGGTTQPPK